MQLALLSGLIITSSISALAFLLLPGIINAWLNRQAAASLASAAAQAKRLRAQRRRAHADATASGHAHTLGGIARESATGSDDLNSGVAAHIMGGDAFSGEACMQSVDGPLDILIMVSCPAQCLRAGPSMPATRSIGYCWTSAQLVSHGSCHQPVLAAPGRCACRIGCMRPAAG